MHTSFSPATWQAFKADDRPGPIHMLNLIRLRAQSEYGDGSQATGAEAYAAYSRVSAPIFAELGGRIIWRGGFELLMIGPDSEQWDVCFIAEYPSVGAFIELMRNPTYREAMAHRLAAVADSRLIRLSALPAGQAFAA